MESMTMAGATTTHPVTTACPSGRGINRSLAVTRGWLKGSGVSAAGFGADLFDARPVAVAPKVTGVVCPHLGEPPA